MFSCQWSWLNRPWQNLHFASLGKLIKLRESCHLFSVVIGKIKDVIRFICGNMCSLTLLTQASENMHRVIGIKGFYGELAFLLILEQCIMNTERKHRVRSAIFWDSSTGLRLLISVYLFTLDGNSKTSGQDCTGFCWAVCCVLAAKSCVIHVSDFQLS